MFDAQHCSKVDLGRDNKKWVGEKASNRLSASWTTMSLPTKTISATYNHRKARHSSTLGPSQAISQNITGWRLACSNSGTSNKNPSLPLIATSPVTKRINQTRYSIKLSTSEENNVAVPSSERIIQGGGNVFFLRAWSGTGWNHIASNKWKASKVRISELPVELCTFMVGTATKSFSTDHIHFSIWCWEFQTLLTLKHSQDS